MARSIQGGAVVYRCRPDPTDAFDDVRGTIVAQEVSETIPQQIDSCTSMTDVGCLLVQSLPMILLAFCSARRRRLSAPQAHRPVRVAPVLVRLQGDA